MTINKQWFYTKSSHLILYILGFLLFWEWLRPLEQVTDTTNSFYFVMFSAFCFSLYFLNLQSWLSFLLRIIGLLYILHALFFESSFFSLSWLSDFFEDILVNTHNMFKADWLSMTDMFRSFLFLLLLWVMCYLLHYWLIEAKRVFIFFILTLIYVTVLDTFTPYDASIAIIRIIIVGFFILGCLQFSRIRDNEGIPIRPIWILLLTAMIMLSIGLGFFGPKMGPQWPDPVPFIKSMTTGEFSTSNKIGYGVDDSRLGGSFSDDDTTVFTAEVKKAHYWRVETKDFYTGKGWEISEYIPKIVLDKNNINLDIIENVNNDGIIMAKVLVENIGDHPHIPYPVDLRAMEIPENPELYVEPFIGKLSIENEQILHSYELAYHFPEFSLDALKLANDGDNQFIKEIYTQLPESLPERVEALAFEITKEKNTRYEKVKAIESYFSSQGYKYEKKNVAIPEADQDYVDQFLFETKRGYCDNFSTSMVVLLRSLGIPARWVKGYTQGEYIETLKTGARLYEVKNSNAHSWVEVYFPGIGWVPFEPTRGFRNPYTFSESVIPATVQAEQILQEQEQLSENEILNETEKDQNGKKGNTKTTNSFNKIKVPLKEVNIVLATIFLISVVLYKFRRRLYPYWVLVNYRLRKNKQTPEMSFEVLYKLLRNKGIPLENGETIREYARRVDHSIGSTEMTEFAKMYERILYSNNDKCEEEWKAIMTLWEELIKKILA